VGVGIAVLVAVGGTVIVGVGVAVPVHATSDASDRAVVNKMESASRFNIEFLP